ncbi:hypothetical protein COHA_001640 [Chlorella ohadii]|uniref:Uncharacterized protein n=1 Tax=Chlorella ohadii TaxID=2649997 RepID=A0AAD5H856_9CHLO|nr:hypothetical protein COHA_001640 [Chlorella ohadii]
MSEGLGLPPRPPGPLPRYGSTPAQLNGGSASPPPPLPLEPRGQPVALAYQDVHKRPSPLKGSAWKVWLVLGDCTLIGLAPVLVHMAKDSEGHYPFSPIAVNLLVELCKTLFALGTLLAYGTGRPGPPMYASLTSFVRDARHNRILAIPAGLYAVNNLLKFLMQLYFKPTTAKMLSNLKILVIAVLMRSVMRRSFNIYQWEALFLLVAGITVNQLNYCGKGSGGDMFTAAAMLYTLGSITVPSLASVLNEFGLKKNMETSVLLQNFFLYFFGVLFNVAGLLVVVASGGLAPSAVFSGFSPVTLLLVVNNAMQGVLSSFFYKYADTILKKYSSTIATIFTGIMSALLFGHSLTLNFLLGVAIVFISMHLFFSMGSAKGAAAGGLSPPGKDTRGQRPPQLAVSPSMEHLASLSNVASNASIASLATAEGDVITPLLGPASGARAPALLPR